MTTHHFFSAKGGQGVTTSMVLEAATTQGRVLLVNATDNGDLWGILGFNPQYADEQITEIDDITFACNWTPGDQPLWREHDFDHVFIDHGVDKPSADWDEELVLVIRNCYLAIRRAVHMDYHRLDRIIIVAEPGRSLGEHDIHRVFQCNTINTIHVDPHIARYVDAGLLYARNRKKFA